MFGMYTRLYRRGIWVKHLAGKFRTATCLTIQRPLYLRLLPAECLDLTIFYALPNKMAYNLRFKESSTTSNELFPISEGYLFFSLPLPNSGIRESAIIFFYARLRYRPAIQFYLIYTPNRSYS